MRCSAASADRSGNVIVWVEIRLCAAIFVWFALDHDANENLYRSSSLAWILWLFSKYDIDVSYYKAFHLTKSGFPHLRVEVALI